MNLKKFFRSPYPYIFLLSYYGVWLTWGYVRLPFSNPVDAISYLPSIGYNPSNNILRFLLAVLVPPLTCLGYWWAANHGQAFWKKRGTKRWQMFFSGSLVGICILLALCMGLIQGSVKKSPNNVDDKGKPYEYVMVDTFHEGETLGPAVSYSQKNLKPYKDFVVVHGVFQDPLHTAIAFRLFGRSIGAARTFETLLNMLAFVLLYVLFLVLFKRDLIKSAIALVAFVALAFGAAILVPLQSLVIGAYLPFRDIATILFLIFAVLGFRYHLAKDRRWAAVMSGAIGFVAVAGFGNSIDRAFYIFGLAIIWLVMMAFIQKRDFLKSILAWFGLGCVVGFIVLGMALKWDYAHFFGYLLTMSVYKELLDGIVFVRPQWSINVLLMSMSAAIGFVLFWFARLFDRRQMKRKDWQGKLRALIPPVRQAIIDHHVVILLGLTSLFFIRNALGRALLDHFNYSVQWFYIAAIYFLLTYVLAKKAKLLTAYIALMCLGFTLLFCLVMVKKTDIKAESFPAGLSDKHVVRKEYLQTADYIKNNLHGDETFATLTSEGIYYYLVDKPSPVNYPVIWYAFTKDQRIQLTQDFQNNPHIKYLITNNNWTSNIDFISNEQRFPELYEYVHEQYVPVKGFGHQTIWIRK